MPDLSDSAHPPLGIVTAILMVINVSTVHVIHLVHTCTNDTCKFEMGRFVTRVCIDCPGSDTSTPEEQLSCNLQLAALVHRHLHDGFC
jgi:hypothetical protein